MTSIRAALKAFVLSTLVLAVGLVTFGLFIGADAHLFEDRLAYQLDGEVHAFFRDDQLAVHVVRGDTDRGFSVDTIASPLDSARTFRVTFPADSSSFEVTPAAQIESPASRYDDGEPIIALSDIESGFAAFRDFLVTHRVADSAMRWTFGKGHLVLVGDFVDRGASTTQVLWAAYQLEQSATRAGGTVHFIIGNHEIKNLQANFQTAEEKYFHIAGILGKRQSDLFSDSSLLGRWLASKNVVEVINGVAFVHGGLHPDLATYPLALDEINQIVRDGYRTPYYSPVTVTQESFLRSGTTGPAWYRGYFKDDLTPEQVEQGLRVVGAKAAVVGHTLQGKVSVRHGGKVIAIDVKHPKDYLTSFPFRRSEGVLIRNGEFFRLRDDGAVKALEVSLGASATPTSPRGRP